MTSAGKKIIGLFAAVVVVGSGAFILQTELRSVKKAETYSSVVSVWHELTHGDVLGQAGIPITSEWRILTPSEHQTVMGELEKRRQLDKGAGKLDAGSIFRDPWGVPIKIAVRSNSQSTNDVVVWSAGRDTKSGTLDDICYPQEGLHDIPSDLITQEK